jgi:hypothetical protein
MALEPPLTEVGGKVYLVGGVAKPVLLRRENGKGGRIRLVGALCAWYFTY